MSGGWKNGITINGQCMVVVWLNENEMNKLVECGKGDQVDLME